MFSAGVKLIMTLRAVRGCEHLGPLLPLLRRSARADSTQQVHERESQHTHSNDTDDANHGAQRVCVGSGRERSAGATRHARASSALAHAKHRVPSVACSHACGVAERVTAAPPEPSTGVLHATERQSEKRARDVR